jgi:RimJ/RimL family protein N-acetyltransferase
MKIQLGIYQIRSYEINDQDALMKYANNDKISKNLRDSFPYPYTERESHAWISAAINQNPELNFAIANNDELIGGIGLMLQPDVYRFSAEIGYWIAEPFWGKGIASLTLLALSKYAFEQFDLNRIFAGVFQGNRASMRVLEKSGFKLEGRLRNAVYKENRFKDQLMYSILKEDLLEK